MDCCSILLKAQQDVEHCSCSYDYLKFIAYCRSFEASVEEEEKQAKAPASKSPLTKSPPPKPKSPATQPKSPSTSQMNDVDDVCFPLMTPKQELHEVEDELLSQESNNTNNRYFVLVEN